MTPDVGYASRRSAASFWLLVSRTFWPAPLKTPAEYAAFVNVFAIRTPRSRLSPHSRETMSRSGNRIFDAELYPSQLTGILNWPNETSAYFVRYVMKKSCNADTALAGCDTLTCSGFVVSGGVTATVVVLNSSTFAGSIWIAYATS